MIVLRNKTFNALTREINNGVSKFFMGRYGKPTMLKKNTGELGQAVHTIKKNIPNIKNELSAAVSDPGRLVVNRSTEMIKNPITSTLETATGVDTFGVFNKAEGMLHKKLGTQKTLDSAADKFKTSKFADKLRNTVNAGINAASVMTGGVPIVH